MACILGTYVSIDTTDACSIDADPLSTILGPMLDFGRNVKFFFLEWN